MFGALLSIVDVSSILYFLIILHMNKRAGSVGGKEWLQAMGPGFDSQVPHLFNIFCFNVLPCSTRPRVYHAASHLSLPHVQQSQSEGHDVNSKVHPQSTTRVQALESQKGPDFLGQTTSISLQIGQTPPNICIPFNLFSFLFHFLILLITFFL